MAAEVSGWRRDQCVTRLRYVHEGGVKDGGVEWIKRNSSRMLGSVMFRCI